MSNLTPEARDLLELFSAQSRAHVADLANKLTEKIDSVRAEVKEEIAHSELRLSAQVSEVKVEQRKQRETQEAQGQKLVQIETRLDEGVKRFDQHEERIEKLEEEGKKTGKGVAYIAGTLAAGGAVGAAVAKIFGGH